MSERQAGRTSSATAQVGPSPAGPVAQVTARCWPAWATAGRVAAVGWSLSRWLSLAPAQRRRKKLMKAVVYTRYGPPDVLRLTDVETPAPKGNEVLVKLRAVSLNASDWEVLRGKPL